MMLIVLFIAALAIAGAVSSIAFARRSANAAANAQRQARDDERIATRPRDWAMVRGLEHAADMVRLRHAVALARRRVREAGDALRSAPVVAWSGAQLVVRVLAFALVVALFGLGLVLNIGIFVALAAGPHDNPTSFGMIFAVVGGVLASMMELLLAGLAAHLWAHREPRSPAWQVRVWATAAALAIVFALVFTYAPARSEHSIGRSVTTEELRFQQLTNPTDGSPRDQVAIRAAELKLNAERDRLHRAQAADQVQALLVPAGQVLTGGLAIEGGLALFAMAVNRRLKRNAAKEQEQLDELLRREEDAELRAAARVARRVYEVGGDDPLGVVNGTAADVPPRGLTDPVNPQPVADEPPTGQPTIDLDDPGRGTDTGAWDHRDLP